MPRNMLLSGVAFLEILVVSPDTEDHEKQFVRDPVTSLQRLSKTIVQLLSQSLRFVSLMGKLYKGVKYFQVLTAWKVCSFQTKMEMTRLSTRMEKKSVTTPRTWNSPSCDTVSWQAHCSNIFCQPSPCPSPVSTHVHFQDKQPFVSNTSIHFIIVAESICHALIFKFVNLTSLFLRLLLFVFLVTLDKNDPARTNMHCLELHETTVYSLDKRAFHRRFLCGKRVMCPHKEKLQQSCSVAIQRLSG